MSIAYEAQFETKKITGAFFFFQQKFHNDVKA